MKTPEELKAYNSLKKREERASKKALGYVGFHAQIMPDWRKSIIKYIANLQRKQNKLNKSKKDC